MGQVGTLGLGQVGTSANFPQIKCANVLRLIIML